MVIGISGSEFRQPEHIRQIPKSDPPRHDFSVSLAYLRAINGAGAIPYVIPPITPGATGQILDMIDGLFVSGGPDIDPMLYDRAPSEHNGPTNAAIDAFQLGLIREADTRRMPLLCVCRGHQMFNVARDGALYQHIPEDFPDSKVSHAQQADGAFAAHDVLIEPGTKLHELMGVDKAAVNSFHHQSVERLGHDLRAVAHAEDGVVEAIEATDRDFAIGVQWHAESMVHDHDTPNSPLYRGLVLAAERYAEREYGE